MRAHVHAWIEALALVGVLRSDSDEERLRKGTLTLASALITALALVWVGTYAVLGLWVSAAIPLAYQLASLLGLAVFARTRAWALFRTSQLALMLALPFLLQWSLGGFVASSGVASGRMESHAPPGTIQVTERVYRRLRDQYVFERREAVPIKGKNVMRTYLLVAPKDDATREQARNARVVPT